MSKQSIDATNAYSSKAEKYAKYRWDYSIQAIQTILHVTQISHESSIADIGAGTGILTKHFVDKVKQVFAIEPNPEMRHIAAKELRQHPACQIIQGQAEATTLPDHSVDLVTVAQAIHWFEPEPARTEFLRILKSDGWLAILRNYDTDDKLHHAIGEVLTPENGIDISHASEWPEARPINFYYGNNQYRKLTFPFTMQETWEEFIGALCSASYVPDEGNPLYINLERAARKVFERYCSNSGLLEVHGVTELCLGQVTRP